MLHAADRICRVSSGIIRNPAGDGEKNRLFRLRNQGLRGCSGRTSGGGGLSAFGCISSVEALDRKLRLRISDLEIIRRPIGIAQALSSNAEIFKAVYKYVLERLWALDESEANEFHALIVRSGGFKSSEAEAAAWRDALTNSEEQINLAIQERQLRLQKARPGQSHFRDVAMKRHMGRCIITRCTVPEAIEAAHVIPHTGEPMFERPDNSLLLRADLHRLFDSYLISIEPGTGAIAVSSRLSGSAYGKLAGKVVDHKLAGAALHHHYGLFSQREHFNLQADPAF